ncbi:hypothetical protein BS50DRAFT_576134 [Corynespora cassiicola Philippines]|uniref:Uncharacterized protein n=1 Tax=Corynespora cassiicola Philippines TaxID=1448308 RepID=A0A2T2NH33_CORCC|nr:hypothetical protein BS50DRAFT_576134 [Corynespora cassiicola Philippines]
MSHPQNTGPRTHPRTPAGKVAKNTPTVLTHHPALWQFSTRACLPSHHTTGQPSIPSPELSTALHCSYPTSPLSSPISPPSSLPLARKPVSSLLLPPTPLNMHPSARPSTCHAMPCHASNPSQAPPKCGTAA